MKAKDTMWFSDSAGCLGLVAAENGIGETVFLLGRAEGADEEEDSQHIADWGAKVSPAMVINFFQRHTKKEG